MCVDVTVYLPLCSHTHVHEGNIVSALNTHAHVISAIRLVEKLVGGGAVGNKRCVNTIFLP